jgi:hypothetical protein
MSSGDGAWATTLAHSSSAGMAAIGHSCHASTAAPGELVTVDLMLVICLVSAATGGCFP